MTYLRALFLMGIITPVLMSYSGADVHNPVPVNTHQLKECFDHQLGLRFYCQEDWVIHRVEDAFFLIISSQPSVSMTVSRTASRITYISQLTNKVLEEMGRYEEGFKTEHTRLAGQDALLVKAFSKGRKDVRLQDYFFIKDGVLFSIFVLIKPAEHWEDYKFVLKEVLDSFMFFPST